LARWKTSSASAANSGAASLAKKPLVAELTASGTVWRLLSNPRSNLNAPPPRPIKLMCERYACGSPAAFAMMATDSGGRFRQRHAKSKKASVT
jgi:hypothetical protein